jgi:type IV pilus secretin PilQ/predicted competence protein
MNKDWEKALFIRLPKCLFIALFILISCAGSEPLLAQNAPAPAQPPKDVNLDYADASLTSVLKALAYSYDLNLVITKDITGKVSAQLKNITLDEALDAILSVNGYTYTRKDNIIYIVPGSQQEQTIESIALSYLSAKEAKQLLSKAISERGDIQVNEATNSLIIMDDVRRMEKIRALIAEIDVAPIQVLIEARVVDISATEIEKIGVVFRTAYAPGRGLFERSTMAPESMTLGTNLPATEGGEEFQFGTILKSVSMSATIDALVQKNKANILASPSIATLNGQEARIIIGERYPYTQVTNNTSGNTQSTLWVDVGTTLRVTPQVSPDGWITMKVHPEVSSVVAALAAGPRITTREADATIRVKDNETIVIGGLVNRKDDIQKAGIPILRSIPLIGRLFRRSSSDIENAELTVFITPHIIRSPQGAPLPKNDGSREVYVKLKDEGKKDMDILAGLLAFADSLENDSTKDSANDLYTSSELLKTYKMILEEFPHSGKADYCLYKIVGIYATKFGKCSAAHEALMKLKELYQDSPYIRAADDYVNTCLDEPALKAEKIEKTEKKVSSNNKSL